MSKTRNRKYYDDEEFEYKKRRLENRRKWQKAKITNRNKNLEYHDENREQR